MLMRRPRRNPLAFPTGNAPRFDPSHPAAGDMGSGHGYSWIAHSGGGLNLLSGRPTATSGGGTGPASLTVYSPFGPVLAFPNIGDSQLMTGQSTAVNSFQTQAAIFSVNNAAGVNYTICNNGGSGEGLAVNIGTGNLILRGQGAPADSGIALTTNAPYFCIISANLTGSFLTATTHYLVLNLLTGSTQIVSQYPGSPTGLAASAPSGTVEIFAVTATGGTNYIAAAMFSPSMMTVADMRAWAADPWSFWYPPTAPAFGPSVSASGFKPYWSVPNNFIGGGGVAT